MTAIALPSTFRVDSFLMRLQTVQRSFAAPFGGSEQVLDGLNDRWMVSLTLPRNRQDTQASNEAFIAALRGMTNTVALWHMARPAPRGTMRGTPLCGTVAQGASAVQLATVAGATLLAGDLIGISGLLLMAAVDCVADGAGGMTVPLVNRVRTAITTGSAVTWDKPKVQFRLISIPSIQYGPGYAEGTALDFGEVIS